MARSVHSYTQTVIGDCGHVCQAWPLLGRLGSREEKVICDICTREQLGVPKEEVMSVWVRVVPEDKPVSAPSKKPKKERAKKLRCFLCQGDHRYEDCSLVMVLPDGA